MKIEILNYKDAQPEFQYDFCVDRRSPIGNPFVMNNESQEERDRVCDQYEDYFSRASIDKSNFEHTLHKLLKAHKKYGQLRLFCWCVPLRCHSETIKKWLEKNENN